MSVNFKDLTGLRFGRLAVVVRSENSSQGQARWLCVCDCGGERVVASSLLRKGKVKSCGCLVKDNAKQLFTTHGETHSPEHRAWRAMVERCTSPNAPNFKNYGARGITVCAKWTGADGFATFLADMGRKPSAGHSIDRIDTAKGYAPDNCRWATMREQQNNRSNNIVIEIDGVNRTLSEWCRLTGVRVGTAHNRLKNLGWPPERAVTELVRAS